jgi:hypothetical protein
MSEKITFEDPEECFNCGFRPVHRNNDGQAISPENQWLVIRIPGSVVWMYVCPACNAVMGNRNSVENVKKALAARESRIVKPRHDMKGEIIA